MVHTADTMDFFRLGDLAGAVDERARKPALARCAFAVGHKQGVRLMSVLPGHVA